MQITKRVRAKKTSKGSSTHKTNRGIAAMSSVKYAITTIVVICAVILVALTVMGPKIGLQTPPIEPKALHHVENMHFLDKDESIQAYKATSYYSYNSAVVVTNKRIFAFYRNKVISSIPLDKITMVLIKDSELGHQEVMISAQADGVIGLDLHHSDVAKLLSILHVPSNMIKHYNKHDMKEAVKAKNNTPVLKTPAATKPAPAALPAKQ